MLWFDPPNPPHLLAEASYLVHGHESRSNLLSSKEDGK